MAEILTREEFLAQFERANGRLAEEALLAHDAAQRAQLAAKDTEIAQLRALTEENCWHLKGCDKPEPGFPVCPWTQRDRIKATLRDVLELINDGYLVRNIKDDGEPRWAMRQLLPMAILKRAQDIAGLTIT